MKSRITIFLSLLLVVAVALPAQAEKGSSPFRALGDTSDRVPTIGGPTDKGLLDCSSATPVMLDMTYSGDTSTGVNNVSTYGCSSFDESGPELVYVLELTEPTMFTVNLLPEVGVDLDLAVLDQCDEDLGCLIVADTGVSTLVPQVGTIYFVVDGYLGVSGTFDLEFIQDPLPEPIDACARVEQPLPGQEGDVLVGNYSFAGDTCGSPNSVETQPCGFYTEAGADNWYEIVLLPGASIDVTMTHSTDGALWLFDACAEPFDCLGYADDTLSGEPETLSYTNTTGSQQVVYLVVDSYVGFDGIDCGTFTADVVINPPGVIGLEASSWGEVKARF